MNRFSRNALAATAATVLTWTTICGCGKSQAEKKPEEIPPLPTGIQSSDPGQPSTIPIDNPRRPPGRVPVR